MGVFGATPARDEAVISRVNDKRVEGIEEISGEGSDAFKYTSGKRRMGMSAAGVDVATTSPTRPLSHPTLGSPPAGAGKKKMQQWRWRSLRLVVDFFPVEEEDDNAEDDAIRSDKDEENGSGGGDGESAIFTRVLLVPLWQRLSIQEKMTAYLN